jgi:hypothetical protein
MHEPRSLPRTLIIRTESFGSPAGPDPSCPGVGVDPIL